ncbi:hypothetical protein GW846_04825 [Candidatus Gracilibacteria bacterium]|nr:hypothetical protein [Candidatus Gracilibacteria bacterium]
METKHVLGGAAVLGAGAYAIRNGVPEIVAQGAALGAGAVSAVANVTNEAVTGLLTSTGLSAGISGTVLPTVATTAAGYYLGSKVAEWTKQEGKIGTALKLAGSAAGLGAGLASQSVAMPYILAAAGLIAVKDIPLWALGKAGQGVSAAAGAATGFAWGGVKGAFKGGYNNTKDKWVSPGIKPNVGF